MTMKTAGNGESGPQCLIFICDPCKAGGCLCRIPTAVNECTCQNTNVALQSQWRTRALFCRGKSSCSFLVLALKNQTPLTFLNILPSRKACSPVHPTSIVGSIKIFRFNSGHCLSLLQSLQHFCFFQWKTANSKMNATNMNSKCHTSTLW